MMRRPLLAGFAEQQDIGLVLVGAAGGPHNQKVSMSMLMTIILRFSPVKGL